ncbi:MAG: iron ABC transporter permease [Alphaproteobacteria bacterium]|nr:iron ABC transporter permease [Alphaproteobacteria bacterium]
MTKAFGLLFAIVLLSAADSVRAQGVFGLGDAGEGYALVTPGREFDFPADHGAHDGYRIEWWYVTANLADDAGNRYGVQWTLFRVMMRPPDGQVDIAGPWASPWLFIGHAALTTAREHLAAERFARGDVGQAGVAAAPAFEAWIDDWRMRSTTVGSDGLAGVELEAAGDGFSYHLDLGAHGPLVLHGDSGFSRKSSGAQASYYYSQPSFRATGDIVIDGERHAVSGTAWMDREWSSQLLARTQTGWDWFSLSFADGARAMMFRLRDATRGDYLSGTYVTPAGEAHALAPGDIILTPVKWKKLDAARVPVEWRVQAPSVGIDVRTTPLNPDSWMDLQFPYWEGPIKLAGDRAGVGYLEMTGYDASTVGRGGGRP